MHNTQKYTYTVLTVSFVHTLNCVGEMRERGGAPIGQSGVVTSGATESHSMQLATGSQESSSHLSILSSLSEDLSLQGFSVFWKISISVGGVEEVEVASLNPYLHCLQFLQISPWTTFSLFKDISMWYSGVGRGGWVGVSCLIRLTSPCSLHFRKM